MVLQKLRGEEVNNLRSTGITQCQYWYHAVSMAWNDGSIYAVVFNSHVGQLNADTAMATIRREFPEKK